MGVTQGSREKERSVDGGGKAQEVEAVRGGRECKKRAGCEGEGSHHRPDQVEGD